MRERGEEALMRKLIDRVATLCRDASGNMALEFALLLPAILILLGGLLEFGAAMYASSALESAARAGAHYAFEKGLDKTGIEQAVKGASTYPAEKLTVGSSMSCECAGAPVSCSSECTGGYAPYKFVTVNVSAPNSPWFPVVDKLVPITFQGSAVVQVP
jgi:Flp pilus assembly protein TadG